MIGNIDPKTAKAPNEDPAANRIHHGRAPIVGLCREFLGRMVGRSE